MSRRDLSEEERALWRGVARSVKPLRKRVTRPSDHGEAAAAGAPAKAVKSARPVKAPAKPPTRAPAKAGKFVKLAPPPSKPSAAPVLLPSFAPTLAPLARREKQHLARGRTAIDARIDLHGMTQAQAHGALAHFLRRAQHDGAKFVLVVTGKGARSADQERGVLRRQVPHWLRLPDLREVVLGFEEAHVAHGGEGALYVRLRRMR